MKKLLMLLMASPLAISPIAIASCGKGDTGEGDGSGDGDLGNGLEEGSDAKAYADFVKQKIGSTFNDFYADRSSNLVTIATDAPSENQQSLQFFKYDNMSSLVTSANGSTTITLSTDQSQLLLQELQSNALFSSEQLNISLNKLADEAGFNVYLDKSKPIFTGFELSDTTSQVEISSQTIANPSGNPTTLITFTVGVTPQYIFDGRGEAAPSTDFTFSFFSDGNSKFATFFQQWVDGTIGNAMYTDGITQFNEDKLNMGGDATHEATHEQNEVGAFDSLSTSNPNNDATKHRKLQEAFLEYTTSTDATPDDNVNKLFDAKLKSAISDVYTGGVDFDYTAAGVESSTNNFGSVGVSDAQVVYVDDGVARGDDAANLFFREQALGANASSTPVDFINYLDEQAFSTIDDQSATEAFTSQYTTNFGDKANKSTAISYGKVSIKGIKLNLTTTNNIIEMPALNLNYDYTPTVITSNQSELGGLPAGLNGVDANEQVRLAGYYYLLTKYFDKWREATGIFASDSTNGVIQFHPNVSTSWNTRWDANSANAAYFGRFLNPLYDIDQNTTTDSESLGLSPAKPYADSTLTLMGYMAKNYFLKTDRPKDQASDVSIDAHSATVYEHAANNYPSLLVKANTMVGESGLYWGPPGSEWKWYNNKSSGGSWIYLTADSATAPAFELRISSEYFYFKVSPSAAQYQAIYNGTLPYLAQVV